MKSLIDTYNQTKAQADKYYAELSQMRRTIGKDVKNNPDYIELRICARIEKAKYEQLADILKCEGLFHLTD